MKKKLVILPLIIIALLLFVAPVCADDPPDMDVDIGVSTPGDVDMDVDIDAGGDVSLTVDGYDLDEVASQASQGAGFSDTFPSSLTSPGFTYDWYTRWNREIQPYAEAINQHNNILDLLANAQARLITEQTLTDEEIASINAEIETIKDALLKAIEESRAKEEELAQQLTFGAEAHIAANLMSINSLDDRTFATYTNVALVTNRTTELESYAAANSVYLEWLTSETQRLDAQSHELRRLLQITWMGCAAFVLVFAIVLVHVARKRKGV